MTQLTRTSTVRMPRRVIPITSRPSEHATDGELHAPEHKLRLLHFGDTGGLKPTDRASLVGCALADSSRATNS